jgi:hypothetical protein
LYLLPCWCNVERTSVASAWSWATSIVLYLSIRLCSAIHPLSHSMPGTTWYQSQRGTSSGPARSGLRVADGSSTRAAGGRRSGVGHALDGDLLGGGTLDKVVLATDGGVICGGGFSGGGALDAPTVVTSAGKDVAASAVVALWVTWVELQRRARRWHRQPRHPGRWHSRVRGQPHRPQPETPCQHCPGQQQRPRRGRTRRRRRLSSGQQHWHIGHERQ